MTLVLQNILRFIILILIQVFVLDNIQFMGYVTPMIYILFILSLPVRLPRGLSLILAFLIGLIVDMFNNTMGLHAFACVFMAFFRKPVVRMFVSLDEGVNPSPSFRTFGVSPYVKYVLILTLLHHISLFLAESFSFMDMSLLFPKIILSWFVTVVLILGVKSLNSK